MANIVYNIGIPKVNLKEKDMRSYTQRVALGFTLLLNVILGGELYQSVCALHYDRECKGKMNLVWLFDLLLGQDHCLKSWTSWQDRKRKLRSLNPPLDEGDGYLEALRKLGL